MPDQIQVEPLPRHGDWSLDADALANRLDQMRPARIFAAGGAAWQRVSECPQMRRFGVVRVPRPVFATHFALGRDPREAAALAGYFWPRGQWGGYGSKRAIAALLAMMAAHDGEGAP